MNVIKRKTLAAFWAKHNTAEASLLTWFKIARKANWDRFQDVKRTFGSADAVKVASGRTATVFDVGGNNIRVVSVIDYPRKTLVIRYVFTHTEYDRSKWREKL